MKHFSFSHGSLLFRNFIGTMRKKFREYVNQCLTSGFIPRTFLPLQLLGRFLARIQIFVQVGRIRLIGAENLKVQGRVIFCPNHSSMFDAPVIYASALIILLLALTVAALVKYVFFK